MIVNFTVAVVAEKRIEGLIFIPSFILYIICVSILWDHLSFVGHTLHRIQHYYKIFVISVLSFA